MFICSRFVEADLQQVDGAGGKGLWGLARAWLPPIARQISGGGPPLIMSLCGMNSRPDVRYLEDVR